MFGWFKRKKQSAEGANEPIITALLIEGPTFDIDAAQRAVVAARPAGLTPSAVDTSKGILNFKLGSETVFVAPMPVPYPWSDLEGPCETSWMWPSDKPAASEVRGTHSHTLVTSMMSSADPITRRVLLAHVVGALAGLPGVKGVYWPDATLVHYPPVFAEMAATGSREAPPLLLLVDFRVFRNEDGSFGLFTTGLASLGMMEMEIAGLEMLPGELRDWAMNIALYLLDHGQPIPDGDTIGATADEQLKVRHKPSSFGAPGRVMRITQS